MKFTDNPYYSPEKCGLKLIHEIDIDPNYSFDIFAIWQKLDDGTVWWDTDSGCSCPSPFDPADNGHDLKQVTLDDMHGFNEALKNHYNITDEYIIKATKIVKDLLTALDKTK